MRIELYYNDNLNVPLREKKKNTATKNTSVKRNTNEMCDQNVAKNDVKKYAGSSVLCE